MISEQDPKREASLMGGLKNAIERGSSSANARRSFISAGYSETEVARASQLLAKSGEVPRIPVDPNIPEGSLPQVPGKKAKSPKKGKSKAWVWITVIISIMVLGVALFLGLFWD